MKQSMKIFKKKGDKLVKKLNNLHSAVINHNQNLIALNKFLDNIQKDLNKQKRDIKMQYNIGGK